jgi:hypothetical protein
LPVEKANVFDGSMKNSNVLRDVFPGKPIRNAVLDQAHAWVGMKRADPSVQATKRVNRQTPRSHLNEPPL